ncbi:unknown [Clostridium sp. CAG:273]|nr:unknown [Clostridium sp. CAG:273]
MKKNLIILISILLIICAFVVYFVINYRNMQMQAQINNKEYNTYKEKTIVGTTLVSIINKTVDNNEKNNIEKDNSNVYIENEDNSIKIYIYFLDEDGKRIETPYTMEQIYNKGSDSFIKLYGTSNFTCTNIDYHSKTGNVKSLTFEQKIY